VSTVNPRGASEEEAETEEVEVDGDDEETAPPVRIVCWVGLSSAFLYFDSEKPHRPSNKMLFGRIGTSYCVFPL